MHAATIPAAPAAIFKCQPALSGPPGRCFTLLSPETQQYYHDRMQSDTTTLTVCMLHRGDMHAIPAKACWQLPAALPVQRTTTHTRHTYSCANRRAQCSAAAERIHVGLLAGTCQNSQVNTACRQQVRPARSGQLQAARMTSPSWWMVAAPHQQQQQQPRQQQQQRCVASPGCTMWTGCACS